MRAKKRCFNFQSNIRNEKKNSNYKVCSYLFVKLNNKMLKYSKKVFLNEQVIICELIIFRIIRYKYKINAMNKKICITTRNKFFRYISNITNLKHNVFRSLNILIEISFNFNTRNNLIK